MIILILLEGLWEYRILILVILIVGKDIIIIYIKGILDIWLNLWNGEIFLKIFFLVYRNFFVVNIDVIDFFENCLILMKIKGNNVFIL